MSVSLRPMTPGEFVSYEEADALTYASNMVKAGYWSAEGALKRAKDMHANLLPHGVNTTDHFLLVIEASQEDAPIGVVWLSIRRNAMPPTGFIYDLLIYEPFRRRGYGSQAMLALEDKAHALGLASLALHAFEDNEPARALYAKLGYRGKSRNMTKSVPNTRNQGAA